MEDQFTYQDFDLLIERGPPDGFRARVLRSPMGESAFVQFFLPFSEVELENLVLKVGPSRRGTRGPGRPESTLLKDFGGKLYGAVFTDELRDLLRSSLNQTRAQGVGLRLRLRLADVPELANLPWEFLYDPRLNRFLAQSRHTPLVRYLDLPDPPQPRGVAGPLRLLVMISSPSGYYPLDVEQEWRLLTGALAEPQQQGRVVIERLPATMSTLRRRLRQEEFHIFHFVGHGSYKREWDDGVLVMEDRNGQPHEVTGEELGGLLNESDHTRLAVLNACEGARGGVSDPFAGVAQSLIQQGLPAVVAMQFAITDDAAIIFAHELYAAIADGYPLEAALADARGAIRDEGNPTEWGTPVLYSRAPDGRLFDLSGQSRTLEAERKARDEAERKARDEAERKARDEAERKARDEAERKARDEAELKARQEAERKARKEAKRKARKEAEQQARTPPETLDAPGDIDPMVLGDRAEAAGDFTEAERWFRVAAEARNTDAMNRLALLLHNTLGRTSEAESWFHDAANAGNTHAMVNLGLLAQYQGDADEAEEWLHRAVEAGSTDAMELLTALHSSGPQIPAPDEWETVAVPDESEPIAAPDEWETVGAPDEWETVAAPDEWDTSPIDASDTTVSDDAFPYDQ